MTSANPVDQPVVSDAINIAGGIFVAVAGDNLTYQLEVLIVHVDPLVQMACSVGGPIFAASRELDTRRRHNATKLNNAWWRRIDPGSAIPR